MFVDAFKARRTDGRTDIENMSLLNAVGQRGFYYALEIHLAVENEATTASVLRKLSKATNKTPKSIGQAAERYEARLPELIELHAELENVGARIGLLDFFMKLRG